MQRMVDCFVGKYRLGADVQTRYIDLVSEVGELGKEIIRATDYGRKGYSQNAGAVEEVGDCLFSLIALCSEMGVSAEEALCRAIQKYEARFELKGSVGSG